jgi:hypothetical protein
MTPLDYLEWFAFLRDKYGIATPIADDDADED